MDDDLPKEGELYDITKKRSNHTQPQQELKTEASSQTKFPVGIILALIILAVLAFLSKSFFNDSVDPEKVAIYKESSQSVFNAMKDQIPYLTSVTCEGSVPDNPSCVDFVGTFVPNKESLDYTTSMTVNDKVEGATTADIEKIKSNLRILVDAKRITIASRKPLTFLILSTTVSKVGEESVTKVRCKEEGGNTITCETIR